MLVLKTATAAMSVVLVMQTSMVVALSLGMYKSCLYECLNCVNTWGKDLFNGEMCAENCAVTGGGSIDTTCAAFFTRSSRRASGARQFLHSEDPSGRYRHRMAGGHSTNYLGYRGYRSRNFGPGAMRFRSYSGGRSTLSRDCQQMCRTCEARFTSNMDAHSCLYTCVRTRKRVVAC